MNFNHSQEDLKVFEWGWCVPDIDPLWLLDIQA